MLLLNVFEVIEKGFVRYGLLFLLIQHPNKHASPAPVLGGNLQGTMS